MTGRPKPCQVCGVRPPAMREIPHCFQCWPGGPITPPPCRKCGSTEDYFTSGLCARCHSHAPGQRSPVWKLAGPLAEHRILVDSCPDCLGWGVTRTYGWSCAACRSWRENYPNVDVCPTCARTVPLHTNGYCRLCHKQRTLVAREAGRRLDKVSFEVANRYGQQLYLVGMWHAEGHGRVPYRKKTIPPNMTRLRPVDYEQLTLFHARHDLHAGLRNGFPPPPDPHLEAALIAHAHDFAARHGWSRPVLERVLRGLRILLGIQDTPGARIRASQVELLTAIRASVRGTRDLLDDVGMLDDDRVPTIERWFTQRTVDLPAQTIAELRIWLEIMRHGSTTPPRRRPRADGTTRTQLDFALPALTHWATTHESLREISREDFLAILPASGTPRAILISGVRSIFRVLKGRKIVFTDPTYRIPGANSEKRQPLPLDPDTVRDIIESDDPARAALGALTAFHGLRSGQLATLQLTDIHDGRLHLDGRSILLATPVRHRIETWLDFRARRYPNTANPHLFVTYKTALHGGPVQKKWISDKLGIAAQAIRQDRILDEAAATCGDARRVSDLFGMSVTQASRYTTAATDPPGVTEYEHHRRTPRRRMG